MAQSTLVSRPSGQAAARELVKSIAKDHGYLGDDVYARMEADVRREVQEAMLAKDKLIGSSVTVLARELYSKDVRFIFELLQNADDNHYTKAKKAGTEPYVSFHHYSDRVVIECNEDGFTEANIRAICSIGQSSKTGAQGYIGEKGIGFKSIFKVAWKAHIQSGCYSFVFIHRPGDSGLGMISPEWEEIPEQQNLPCTRITLYLHENSNDNRNINVEAQHNSIKEQLGGLQATMLLFLKRLTRINIHFHGDDAEESSVMLAMEKDVSNNRTTLGRDVTRDGDSNEIKNYYHVTTHTAAGLARSDNRTYSQAEEATRAYSKANVVLAFPLSDSSVPIIEQQEVFAFLPIRPVGFNFLIQSDFVTMANREDVVTSSSRNVGLLDGIADALILAVQQMCDHEGLQYQWMRYLANLTEYPWDPFWQKLVDKIKTHLTKVEILRPRRRGPLRRIGDLSRLSLMKSDRNSEPLFADLPGSQERYLSTGYMSKDLDILQKFGLNYMFQNEFLDRVKRDLSVPDSKMKSQQTSEDWHERAAEAIDLSFTRNWTERIADTKALSLLPLCDGRWVSANSGSSFFPTVKNEIFVPGDLGLQLLNPKACSNAKRKKLFINLGVNDLDIKLALRPRILNKYKRGDLINLQASYAHLVFLYLTHEAGFEDYKNVKLYDHEGYSYLPETGDLYFISDDPQSLWQLSQTGDFVFEGVHFVHPQYLENPPKQATQHNITWKDWLHSLGIRRYPRLVHREHSRLSPECVKVAEKHPKRFLSFLRYAWNSEGDSVVKDEDALEELADTEVCCQFRGEEMFPLRDSYLPLPGLKAQCSRLMGDDEFFPFLHTEEPLAVDGDVNKWSFLLEHLEVKSQDGWPFYVQMLSCITDSNTQGNSANQMGRPGRLIEIYGRIHSRCRESADRRAELLRVRNAMSDFNGIFIPAYKEEKAVWTKASTCVLDAPGDMIHKHPIMARYEAAFSSDDADLNMLASFFGDTMGIEKCSWRHNVDEIKALKNEKCSDFDRVTNQYIQLDKERHRVITLEITTEEIRKAFEENCLVFIPLPQSQSKWVKISQCLWSSAAEIRGKFNLNSYYDDDFENFFVECLGVERLHFNIVYDELLSADPSTTSVDAVKDLLWSLNSFLGKEDQKSKPDRLLKRPILPVRYPDGNVRLVSSTVEFAIIDRQSYGKEFGDKVKMLHFDHAEIHRLLPFLRWANLETRYLSRLVKEISIVESGVTYPLSNSKWEVRIKAHALTRVAVHLNSPRTRGGIQAFYNLFRNAETLETEGISAEHILSQDGKRFSVQIGTSKVHIGDSSDSLKIYVPHDTISKSVCFFSALPNQLVEWMMRDPITHIQEPYNSGAPSIMKSILTAEKGALNEILELEGIIEVDIPELDEEDINDGGATVTPQANRASSSSSEENVMTPGTTPLSRTDELIFPEYSAGLWRYRDESISRAVGGEFAHSPSRRTRYGSPHAFPPLPVPAVNVANQEYTKLLDHVIQAARSTDFPSHRDFSTSGNTYRGPSSLNESLMFYAPSQLERDRKIGAVGELFVFELLSSLVHPTLAGFNRDNWQSTIRKYITVHPEYANMQPWHGRETADITYEDQDGDLTDLLINKGYLAEEEWGDRKPQYYIEVKSTVGVCSTPFYMSDSQYHKMKQYSTDNSMYVIFRVFNMTKDSIGVRIYVNPDQMREEEELVFKVDAWSVTPGRSLEADSESESEDEDGDGDGNSVEESHNSP